jgi:hypothetical protein
MSELDNAPNEGPSLTLVASNSSEALTSYWNARLANIRKSLPVLARQLQDAGVCRVHIIYDGCGDSGCIDTVDYTDGVGKPVTGVEIEKLTEAQVLDLFYDLTQARHPGWENNDGAFGEFEWNLSVDSLLHTHSDRYTEYDTTEHEGL